MDFNDVQFQFPVYVIGPPEAFSAVEAETNGQEWFLLYETKEIAQAYIQQSGTPYVPHEVNDVAVLKSLLDDRPDIDGYVWNFTDPPEWLKFIERSEF